MLRSFEEQTELKTLSSHFQALFYSLIQAEVSHRTSRSLAYRLDLAKLPNLKTFENFDLSNVTFAQEKLKELEEYEFIKRRENILLVGGSGTGKTHLALAFGYEAIQRNYRVKHYRFSELTKQLQAAHQINQAERMIAKLCRFDLLIVDEWGYVSVDSLTEELLFELFNRLYETTSVILTTHLTFNEWETVFGNKKSTRSMIDRMTHHCHILETGNKSWRLKSAMEKHQKNAKEAKDNIKK